MWTWLESNLIGKSWRTSVAGWVCLAYAIIGAARALLDGDPSTSPAFDEIVTAAAGIGLIAARDAKQK